MWNFVPAEENIQRAWLHYLLSVAKSGVVAALLDAQIADLEKRCAALREHLNENQRVKYVPA